jgi:hypothetical protein
VREGLAHVLFSSYLKNMYFLRPFLPLLLSLALLGAPFGMGRMMDQVHQTMHAAHGMQHGTMPEHKGSTPHYVICAACVASIPQSPDFELTVLDAELTATVPSSLSGTHFLPPVPPPKRPILTV